ncbi:fungal-specific transcription factor domain-containing protein [Xylogone sp. PMI_703]|nr:fungal-specific transcription factor domain-containing protein [Xylogone sp. PMI_703]
MAPVSADGGQAVVAARPVRFVEGRPATTRRPQRASRACEMCRSRKTKCNQQLPCSHCEDYGLQCSYRSGSRRSATRYRRLHENESNTAAQWPKSLKANSDTNSAHSSSKVSETNYSTQSRAMLHTFRRSTSSEDTRPQLAHTISKPLAGDIHTGAEGQQLWNDGVGGVNAHTSGTEFYGGSSILAFLDRLFARTQKEARACPQHESDNVSIRETITRDAPDADNQHLNNERLSVVDLMYSTDYSVMRSSGLCEPSLGKSSPENSLSLDTSRISRSVTHGVSRSANRDVSDALDPSMNNSMCANSVSSSVNISSLEFGCFEVGRIFVDVYFTNKHYIHPFLNEDAFRSRCAKEIWKKSMHEQSRQAQRSRSTLLPLYYAVVALGAINAGTDATSSLMSYYRNICQNHDCIAVPAKSTLEWSNLYFNLAKQSLGDIFETSTLETCQALFLMTVFCQNALKPHSCYLYSGMAVRTAIAIGLSSESQGASLARKKEARRTWWCIYSHEVEMCCSSGRLDSLKDPSHYSTPHPSCQSSSNDRQLELEGPEVSIIPVMVELSRILKTASQDIYHASGECSIAEKSQIAFNLEQTLSDWKMSLPDHLNIDVVALNDAECTFKQKLVLRMRLYNARILLHRPFLVASSTSYNPSEFLRHIEICLEASRQTIQMIYDAFTHRIYLRTWWYCATYTLYASMIILHLILLEFPEVPAEELITDIKKSVEIFHTMKSVIVARRCEELTKEMLDVAQRYLQGRHQTRTTSLVDTSTYESDAANVFGDNSMESENQTWNDNGLMALLNLEGSGPERANALASIFDPTTLEGFAAGQSIHTHNTSSTDTLLDFPYWDLSSSGPEGGGSGL